MVYRDVSDGKLKIKYGDLWKVLATLAIIIGSFVMYKASIDSALSKLDYTKASKESVQELEKKFAVIDEKLTTINNYIKEIKERQK